MQQADADEMLEQMGLSPKPVTDLPGLISRMKTAAQNDQKIMREKKGLPAAHKFSMIPEVEDTLLGGVKHSDFIHQGGLYALVSWLEPYADGTMPFRRTRACIMKLVDAMSHSLNASDKDIENLLGTKASKLAHHIARVANDNTEVPENRKIAKKIMERWAKQTYASNTEHDKEIEEKMKGLKLEALRQSRKAAENKIQTVSEAAQEAGLKSTMRVPIPAVSKLDYVINPGMAPGMEDIGEVKPRKSKGDALGALEKAKRKSNTVQRGAKVVIHPSNMMV